MAAPVERFRHAVRPWVAAALASAAACGGSPRSDGDPSISRLPAYILEPDLTFDGGFGQLGAVAVDARGTVFMADLQTQQVSAFRPDGRRLAVLGRRGDGPGEFRLLRDVAAGRGDTLFALDVAAQRISAFTPAPELKPAYTLPLPRAGGMAVPPLMVPRDGGFLLPFTRGFGPGAGPAGGSLADGGALTVRRVAADGTSRDLLELAGRATLVTRHARGSTVAELPFAAPSVVRLGAGDRLYSGVGDSARVTVRDAAGTLLGSIRWPHAPVQVSRGDVRALLASFSADPRSRAQRDALRQAARDGRLPRTRPAFLALLPDNGGGVWIATPGSGDRLVRRDGRFVYGGSSAAVTWRIFDRDGHAAGVARAPAGVQLVALRDGRAYGIATDDDGVQRVVRFRIRPPPRPGAAHPPQSTRRGR